MILAPGHETRLETEPASEIKVMRRPGAKVVCSCGWQANGYTHRSVVPQIIAIHAKEIGSTAVIR